VRAIGIDPGTRHLGWGVVHSEGNRIEHVAHGVIDASPTLTLAERLVILDVELAKVISMHRPAVGSVETLFFHRDAQAAAKLGHARGVALLALSRAKVAVAEYAPAHVKRVITGKGNADKRQVAHMIRALLALDEPPKSDAADALALAITHCRRGPIENAIDARRAPSKIEPSLLARLTRGKRARPRPLPRGVRLFTR
jgi:crossover junction endodeoxyribonuclease RuvC